MQEGTKSVLVNCGIPSEHLSQNSWWQSKPKFPVHTHMKVVLWTVDKPPRHSWETWAFRWLTPSLSPRVESLQQSGRGCSHDLTPLQTWRPEDDCVWRHSSKDSDLVFRCKNTKRSPWKPTAMELMCVHVCCHRGREGTSNSNLEIESLIMDFLPRD